MRVLLCMCHFFCAACVSILYKAGVTERLRAHERVYVWHMCAVFPHLFMRLFVCGTLTCVLCAVYNYVSVRVCEPCVGTFS